VAAPDELEPMKSLSPSVSFFLSRSPYTRTLYCRCRLCAPSSLSYPLISLPIPSLLLVSTVFFSFHANTSTLLYKNTSR